MVLVVKAKSFQKEEFESRFFNTNGVLDGEPLGDDICALFGLLAGFKKDDPGFNICVGFDEGVLNFLGNCSGHHKRQWLGCLETC